MAKTHEGIIPIGFPFEVQTSKPIDDRNVVDTFNDLLTLPYSYEGIPVYVRDVKQFYTKVSGSGTSSSDWRYEETDPVFTPWEASTTKTVSLSGIKMNTAAPYVVSNPGEIGWNAVEGTYDMRLLNNTTLQVGQELHIYGKAIEDIQNRDVIQLAGVQGNHLTLKKAVPAEILVNPNLILGVATQNININSYGSIS